MVLVRYEPQHARICVCFCLGSQAYPNKIVGWARFFAHHFTARREFSRNNDVVW
jgi:hypothetical protein